MLPSKFEHVGVIVRDLDKTIEYYQSLGFGPFEPMPKLPWAWMEEYGKPREKGVVIAIRIGKIGDLTLELIQPVSGKSIHMDFLEKRGEGIQHLAYSVADIDKTTEEMVGKGLSIIVNGRFKTSGGLTYFNSDKHGGTLIEMVQWPPQTP
jgi:methylmalonyl-CoA/ethylmalonyl-CoA epimerase